MHKYDNRNRLFMKRLFYFFLMSLLPLWANAYDAIIDNIYYNLNETNATAQVTYLVEGFGNESAYVGEVVIPPTVSYNGKDFIVTSIGYIAFYYCRDLTSITLPESVTSIGEYAFYGCKIEKVLAKNPLTSLPGAFSDRTFQHAMLYIPFGTWSQAIYDGDWYQFNNNREVSTTSQSLTQNRAYTIMNAQTYKYAVFNGANNNLSTVNAFYGIDEDDPNSSWQVIDKPEGKYVKNIGSRKYLNVLSNGELSLSDNPVLLDVSDAENGITINGTEREWMFVTNNRITVNNTTIVDGINDNSYSPSEYYSIDGTKMNEPQNGINIIRSKDGKSRKVFVR